METTKHATRPVPATLGLTFQELLEATREHLLGAETRKHWSSCSPAERAFLNAYARISTSFTVAVESAVLPAPFVRHLDEPGGDVAGLKGDNWRDLCYEIKPRAPTPPQPSLVSDDADVYAKLGDDAWFRARSQGEALDATAHS